MVRGQQFCHLGVGAALLAGIEQCGGPASDHVGCFELGLGAGQTLFANMQGGVFNGWGEAMPPLTSDYLITDAVDVFNNGHADLIVQQQSTDATYYAEAGSDGFLGWGTVASSLGPHWQAV